MRAAKPATTGHPLLDKIAPIIHYGFYVLVLLMVGTGLCDGDFARAQKNHVTDVGDPLPARFGVYPTFVAHGYLAAIPVILIGLHVLAACYHQFMRIDGLLRRMSLGR